MPNIAAAAAEITLGDKKYTMSPLTDKHIVEMDQWLRVKTIRTAREACADLEDNVEVAKIMKMAFEYANVISWAADGSHTRYSLEGLAQLIHVGIKDSHPEMSPDIIQPLILDPGTLTAAIDVFDLINDIVHDDPKEGEESKTDPIIVPSGSGTP